MRIISNYTKQRNDAEKRCKYGIHEYKCQAWIGYVLKQPDIKTFSAYGSCKLCGSESCPHYKKRIDQGNKKKIYSIDWRTYRKISSSAHYLIKEKDKAIKKGETISTKTLFLTLTFPGFRNKKLTNSFDHVSNTLFCKFVENLRKNYACSGYVGVKEYGEVTNRVHFHLIIGLPFIDFRLLNNIWCNTISDYCVYSSCAVRRAPGQPAIIRNPARAIRYVCKYINKSFGQKSETRTVFISHNILIKPFRIDENGFNHIDYLKNFKSININTFEHVSVFKITDRREFNKFCFDFLYPLFECSFKLSAFYHLTG